MSTSSSPPPGSYLLDPPHAEKDNQERRENDDTPPDEGLEPLRDQSTFPPAFWDNVSRVWFTARALRELDRQNVPLYLESFSPTPFVEDVQLLARQGGAELRRFSRHGGPDLRDLREYWHPGNGVNSSPDPPPTCKSMDPTPGPPDPRPVKDDKRISAYDKNFRQYLVDHQVFFPRHKFPDGSVAPSPENFDDLRQRLRAPRVDDSLGSLDAQFFEEFLDWHDTDSEGTIIRKVVPVLAGDSTIPNDGQLRFTNMELVAGRHVVSPCPDFFDGVLTNQVEPQVRADLNHLIIPRKNHRFPIAANFFLEVKCDLDSEVAINQACHDGAQGTQAMHSLQNFGHNGDLTFEPNATSYSATYHASVGVLQLFAHHSTPSTSGRPSYFMTKLGRYFLTESLELFRDGVTAFRNLRDKAKEDRLHLVALANSRVSPPEQPTKDDSAPVTASQRGSTRARSPHVLAPRSSRVSKHRRK